ncbi:uncharacterized protein LOC131215158 [Anopheles bellator]|uniref:uncharacterized protein LOC131215158 n=1 Tax=Anopheles bellator TaxID=139047 RepID=UPI0026484BA6|nr:uncharacterized protein LOC131215158 [Anopheles bellator]
MNGAGSIASGHQTPGTPGHPGAIASGMSSPPAGPPLKPVSPTTPNDPEQQPEKTDCTPENSKKSDGDSPEAADYRCLPHRAASEAPKGVSLQEMLKSGAGPGARSVSEEPCMPSTPQSVADSVRNAFAFTIDFGDGRRVVDSQRHEKMLERFQARHRRGESLSKLESTSGTTTGSVLASAARQPTTTQRAPQSVNLPRRNKTAEPAMMAAAGDAMVLVDVSGRPVAVKLREKNQRTVGRSGDQVGKRHSWSPRTSLTETAPATVGSVNRAQQPQQPEGTIPGKGVNKVAAAGKGRFAPKSATLAMALEQQQVTSSTGKDSSYFSSEFNAGSVDIPCLEAPLENFRPNKGDRDEDEVSETGTYTLDGDNYTEEQKERMNIDRIGSGGLPEVMDRPVAVRPTAFRDELEVIDLERLGGGSASHPSEKRKHNILEVSYFHESSPVPDKGCAPQPERTKSKQSYMEKLKSRMKNITQNRSSSGGAKRQQQQQKEVVALLESPDQGTFTSVTTSGILSMKPTLDDHPKVAAVTVTRRRNSLTKSHIDSSEYVQGVAKLNIHSTETEATGGAGAGVAPNELKILNCYTDSEKAQQHGAVGVASAAPVPRRKTPSADVAALTSVPTKNDWIEEWAKNAREFSKSTSPKVHPHEPPPPPPAYGRGAGAGMVRSYGGETRARDRNQFGYDFEIDLAKSDYYEAKKYEEFGDNLDHRQQQQRSRKFNRLPDCGYDAQRGAAAVVTASPDEAYGGGALPAQERLNEFTRAGSRGSIRRYGGSSNPSPVAPMATKPPMSPSKIPSPIGSIGRARSVSRNRSLQGSNSDLSGNETEMYLQKTAAAISTLQNLQRRNSLRNNSSSHPSSSPLSPASRKMSPKMSPMNSLHSPLDSPYHEKAINYNGNSSPLYSPQHQRSLQQHQLHQNVGGHKRNHSFDGADPLISPGSPYLANGAGGHMTRSLNTNSRSSPKMDFAKRHHMRHNSFEGVMSSLPPKPLKCFQQFDQSHVVGYYGDEENPGGAPGAADGDEQLGECRDYDEEEFEDDIDDDEEDEQNRVQQKVYDELRRRRENLNDTAASYMPRPRAMSLGPRRAPVAGGHTAVQSHKQNLQSTGAKQAIAGLMRDANATVSGATKNVASNRVHRTPLVTAGGHQPPPQQQQHLTSPIKRSSSFSVKQTVIKPSTPTMPGKGGTGGLLATDRRSVGGSKIQKSASSTSFKKMIGAMDNVQPQQYHHHAVQPPHHRHQLVMDPNYPDELMLYINDGDDDGLQMISGHSGGGGDRRHQQQQQHGYSSNSLTDDEDERAGELLLIDDDGEVVDDDDDDDETGGRIEKGPLTNTRYNKTFLMRMEQNKKIASGTMAASGGGTTAKQSGGGASACPNTPELPRRGAVPRSAGLVRDRASMPRDSSLNRMKQDLNVRKTSAGRESLLGGKGQQQLSTQSIASSVSSAAPASGAKVQPKYLDISKYKPSTAANFLKKDETKSYLLRQEGVRKSPSSASVASAMSRADPTRMSARSIKSASSAASKSSGTAASAAKKDPVKIAKEQELEMWRRRASYDPMKAALEGKKKQLEEAKRLAVQQQQQQQQQHSERQSKSNESSVLRSQSYHSGVGNVGGGRLYQGTVGNSSNANLRGAYNQTLGDPTDPDANNQWTLTSTESSEDLDGDDYIN